MYPISGFAFLRSKHDF